MIGGIVENDLERFSAKLKNLPDVMAKILDDEIDVLFAASQTLIPVDTGELARSAELTANTNTEKILSWKADHARWVYYGANGAPPEQWAKDAVRLTRRTRSINRGRRLEKALG